MTLPQALTIVIRAAEANASGNFECKEIHRAIAVLKEWVKVARRGKK